MGRPQQTFCTIATFPHFTQRKPAIGYSRSMTVAMPNRLFMFPTL